VLPSFRSSDGPGVRRDAPPSPVDTPSRAPVSERANSRPRSVPVVSHHLDGFLLHDLAPVFQDAADPGVHRVSSRRETEFPAMPLLPFEAFPPPTATGSGTNPVTRGPASPERPLPTARFTANLAPSPFPSPRSRQPTTPREVARRVPGRSRGLEALLHRRVRGPPIRCRTDALGAPLGLSEVPSPPGCPDVQPACHPQPRAAGAHVGSRA
jgi:hypothetical protein